VGTNRPLVYPVPLLLGGPAKAPEGLTGWSHFFPQPVWVTQTHRY